MEREPGVYEYEIEAEAGMDIRRDINKIVQANGWPILAMRASDMTLEDMFLKITMGEGLVVPPADDHAKADAEKTEGGAK